MRFKKRPRYPFNDTARKRSYIPIKHRREQEKFPLFAAEIAEGQQDVDSIMAERATNWARHEADNRSRRARQWINLRRALKLLPDAERAAFLRYYYRVGYPLDPAYMHGVLGGFLRGTYLMHQGEVVAQSELDFLAERSAKIAAMTDDELLRRMQSPYAAERYIEELRQERARRAALVPA